MYRPANIRGGGIKNIHPSEFGIGFQQGAVAVGGPNIPPQEANAPAAMVPFRRATTFRTSALTSSTGTITAAQQGVEVNIEGTGYLYGIDVEVIGTAAANAATVAYQEDAPYSSLASVILKDVNGEEINLTGFDLYLVNLYGGIMFRRQQDSTDTNIYSLTSGAGATGGSFRFHLFVPTALNRRTLLGLLGNQDRAQKYTIRTDIAASGSIYSTPPTTLPPFVINRTYENYAVPAPTNAVGAPQQQMPDKFGVIRFLTRTLNPGTPPQGGATANHYLPRVGQTIRNIILVFRSNGSRATAETNAPTRISFKLGDTVVFTETFAYRRKLMYDRFGFDAPAGVLVYDFMTDLHRIAGDEFGDDWAFTNGLVNAQFEITYPAGFGSTNNSLVVITDDLQIPANVDVYA